MCTCEDDGNDFQRTLTVSNGDEGEIFMIFAGFVSTLLECV